MAQTDIAVGNVVGSNIFNLLWMLGVSAVIIELCEVVSNADLVMVIASANGTRFTVAGIEKI